jgi:hypothetical protein
LGTRKEQILPPYQLEISKEHLKVREAHRIRDMAIRHSDIEKQTNDESHVPDNHELLGPALEPEQIKIITAKQSIVNIKSNKWTRRIERRRAMKLVIDSGAMSNFVPEEMNLPRMGKSNKEPYLPDNITLQATYCTELPPNQLSTRAREADILPGLQTPMVSVNKMADEEYTTIFHPGEEGVTIHKPGTLTIAATEPPVLHGRNAKGAKLWTVLADEEATKEQANKEYDLPSIRQTVRYLHATAGFPTEETWIKAIKAGNYNTWPTITPQVVRRHFPESNETQQGHMKRQRQ